MRTACWCSDTTTSLPSGPMCGLRGGETVMQSRMQSRSPVILTVRRSPDAERITSEWRAVIDGRFYEVREDWRPTEDRLFVEMLAESNG